MNNRVEEKNISFHAAMSQMLKSKSEDLIEKTNLKEDTAKL